MRAARRLRSSERLALIAGNASAADEEMRAEALAAGALVAGLQPALGRGTDDDHAAWRARILLDVAGDNEPLERMLRARELTEDDATSMHVALDQCEAELVRGRRGMGALPQIGRRRRDAVIERLAGRERRCSIADPLGEEELRIDLRLYALGGDASGSVATIDSSRLGRLGKLAFEEGELLALRLPDRAIPLLELAEGSLGRAGERYGAFCAALRGAIARVHAGEPEEARMRRDSVLERYRSSRAADPSLPPIEFLVGKDVASSYPGPWRSWVARLTAFLYWCERDELQPGQQPGGLDIDPEFTLEPAAGALGARLPRIERARRRSPRLSALNALFLLGLGLLVSATTVGFGGRLVGWVVAAFLLVVCVFAVAAEFTAARLSRMILPVDGFDISIAPTHWVGDEPRAELRIQPAASRRMVRAYFRILARTRLRRMRTTLPVGENSIEPGRLPGSLRRAVRPTIGGDYLPLRLIVASSLADINWERGLVGHLAREEDWEPTGMPEIRRIRPGGLSVRPPDRWPTRIAAVCSLRWRTFLETSSSGQAKWLAGATGPQEARPRRQEARAAVALGMPIVTHAGYRLRLDDDELNEPFGDPSRPRSQQLLSPEQLVREAPIAVVVGRPGGHRLAAESRTTAGLRVFANEVLLAGAQAVIVVPVLPPAVAAQAISALVEELAAFNSIPVVVQLQQLTGRLRQLLYASELDQGEPRLRRAEVVLDVCLFTPY